jgi:predicted RNase H-like nuclease
VSSRQVRAGQMVWVCGVDGFKSEWCAVLRRIDTMEFRARVVTLRELLSLSEDPKIVALDLPIGLPDITLPGGRSCERLARSLLGWRRARSVFSAVGRRSHAKDRLRRRPAVGAGETADAMRLSIA